MEFIPLIKIKNRKPSYTNDLVDSIDENKLIYIYDIDGIGKDKPNLCTFQKLSKTRDLWIDSGPRDLGDIVDSFMAGAIAITIRENLFPQVDLSKIREISENKIFLDINLDDRNIGKLLLKELDGMTIFKKRDEINQEFKYRDLLKQYSTKNTVYVYESNNENLFFWKNLGINNILVDIDKYEEIKKYDL